MSLFLNLFSLLNRVRVKKWELRKASSPLSSLVVLHVPVECALLGVIVLQLARRFLHISFHSKTSPLFRASSQGSGIAAITRSRAGPRRAGIDGKRQAILKKLHHRFDGFYTGIGDSELVGKEIKSRVYTASRPTAHTFHTTDAPQVVLWLCGGPIWCPRAKPLKQHQADAAKRVCRRGSKIA